MDRTGHDENIPIVYLLVKDDTIENASSSFYELTGYSASEILYQPISKVFKVLLRSGNLFSSLSGEHSSTEGFIFTKDLQPKEVTITLSSSQETNKLLYVLTEKDKYCFDEKFIFLNQLCFENMIGVAIYGIPQNILIKANQLYLSFHEEPYNTIEECIGSPIQQIIPSWYDSGIKHLWTETVHTRKSTLVREFEIKSLKRGITYWDASLTPVADHGTVKYMVVILAEVTDKVLYRRKTEEQTKLQDALQTQRNFFHQMIDILDLPIIRLSYPEYHYIAANRKAQSLAAGSAQSDIGYLVSMLTQEKSVELLPYLNIQEIKKSLNTVACSKNIVHQDKVEINLIPKKQYYRVIYQPLFNLDGEIDEILIIGIDITVEVQERDFLSKTLDMKDEFLSIISHEFKTPLTIINSAVQAMELICKNELSSKSKGFLKKIRQNAYRQLRLVNNLLDLTRANAGKMKFHRKNIDIVLLTRCITESVSLYAQQKGITLDFHSRCSSKIVGIDEEKYERILLNLLSNAIKFTPSGKSVTVRLSTTKAFVKLTVRDKGIGIPRDKQEFIFERFGQVDSSLTRQTEGTGIGLSLVKTLVTAMDGQISLNSAPGKGSIFTVLLPNTQVSSSEEASPKASSDNRLIQITDIEFSDLYPT